MRICAVWHLAALVVLAALMAMAGTALSSEIANIYSSIGSADVTLEGDVAGMALRLDLINEGRLLTTRNLTLDGAGTWVIRWPDLHAEKGSYDVCAGLWKNGTVVSSKCYNFYYGGVEPIRFDVRDFRADSRGMHLAISARDPTVVDIYYMLIDGNKAVYVTREQVIPIAGSYAQPITKDYAWKQILENGREYAGRVNIVELNHNQTRAFMNSFLAVDDAMITETYQDETGASATVMGNSRVPFEGSLRFILSQNGSILNTIEKKTPVLLTGDDETVEITWNKTLAPGIYLLRTVLLGQGGGVMDLEENVVEAKPLVGSNATDTAKNADFPATAVALALLTIVLLRKRR
ncbi:MAG: hypothetical protein M0Q43_05800 [Methanothrix sp.]|jgi:hypothetical protein|nr:hypothetical protein [Methanothrix sp.]